MLFNNFAKFYPLIDVFIGSMTMFSMADFAILFFYH